MLFQTSDSTWQAYNTYGGSSFYQGKDNGRAYKLSYNRPFADRGGVTARDFVFSNEYPMLRFLEQNGYDVSYVSGLDVSTDPALLPKHKTFVSVGHDEYWSKQQRKNVTDARDAAGVNLAFFGGNDVYWKTRWEPSEDGSNTPNRTLVDYKDTWAAADIDPVEPTATWRDPSFGDLGYGYGPENALIGTQFQANSVDLALKVNSTEGKLRLWRNTTLATMAAGSTATLSDHTVGYESNEDVDNGYRPAGLIRMSTTTGPTPEYLTDYGLNVTPGTTTHHLTMYRAASGALVFSAGTIQWSWGLDPDHDGAATPADPRMRQATVNIFADMGIQATTIASDLVATTKSTDTVAPTVTVTAPAAGTTTPQGTMVTVSGTASDVGGQVAGVEVTVDGGATWHPADGTTSWTYSGILNGNGAAAIQVRATDDSAVTSTPVSISVNSPCPCSLFGVATPKVPDAADGSAVTLGVRFTSSADGFISGVRFYKAATNTGTHLGTLYATNGSVLATGTFSNESTSGWQTLNFSSPVAIAAGGTYVAAYYAPQGHYSADQNFFDKSYSARVLMAPGGVGIVNGVYAEGNAFPSSTYKYTNYYVDPVYATTDDSPVLVTSTSPVNGATSIATTTSLSATFSKAISESSLSFQLVDSATQTSVPASVTYNATTRTATLNPTQALANSAAYTATVTAAGVASPVQWSFTTVAPDGTPNVCPCTLFNESDQPTTAPDSDNALVQLGMAFTVSKPGQITGVRFYKNPDNQGIHTVALWNGTTKLADGTATNESASGWQQVNFDNPVTVATGTTYTASYVAPVGRYGSTSGGLSSKITNGPISSVANGGRYVYGTGAPTNTSSANYYVDPVFTPSPDAAPTVRSFSPGNGATSVPVSAHLIATFSTEIQPSSAVITVKRDSDNTTLAGSTSSEAQSSAATFTPTDGFDPGTKYNVTVSGARNTAGTTMASGYTTSFTTAGASACPCTLMESSTQPTQDDAGDGGAVTLGVKFKPSVDGYIKGIRYYRSAANTGTHKGTLFDNSGTALASVNFTDSGTGWQTANFSSSVAVTAGTTYVAAYYAPNGHYSADPYVFWQPMINTPLESSDTGSVYLYGDGFPTQSYLGANYYVDVVFVTSDDTPPSVASVTPTESASGVAKDTTVSAIFSKAITESSMSLTVTDPSGQLVGGQLGYDAATKTATFTTAAPLADGAKYTAAVSASSASGVAMPAPKTWTFTTADAQPPAVASTTPADKATGVAPSTKVTAVFARDIDASSLSLTLKNTSSGASVAGAVNYASTTRTATFTPTANLSGLTSYTATVSAKNISGVAMPSPQSWAFTTVDSSPPVVTTTAPASGATGVAATTKVTATFDRDITASSLVMTLGTSGGSIAGTASYDSATRVATFTPSSQLSYATSFTASVNASSTAGTQMTAAKTWSFTSQSDPTPPSVSATTPASGSATAPVNSTITATFAAATTTRTLTLKTAAGATIAGTSSYSTATRTITFTPSSGLTSSSGYTATVTATSSAGVAMAPYTWSFTTAAVTYSLYTTSQTPSSTSSSTTAITVGVAFQSSRVGKMTAIRYYANSANSGNTVKLWSSAGVLLGTATTTQTGTGWRTATFGSSINISANTTYVASYYAPAGRYSTNTLGYLGTYTSGPLTVSTNGGRTGSGNVFPSTSSLNNMWVDPLVLI